MIKGIAANMRAIPCERILDCANRKTALRWNGRSQSTRQLKNSSPSSADLFGLFPWYLQRPQRWPRVVQAH